MQEDINVFGRKKKIKKDALFGASIEPDCAHCFHSITVQGKVRCHVGESLTNGKCKQYTYDPLRRAPKGQPKLKSYSAKDFEL